MRVGIVGSRNYPNLIDVEIWFKNNITPNDIIISGGARGVDSKAEILAYNLNISSLIIKPDWKANGMKAGFLRNTTIVENSDKLVAFWDGKSRGTKDSIDKARRKGIPVEIIQSK